MENDEIKKRIRKLKEGLEKWKDFLKRVILINGNFEDKVNNIESVYREIKKDVNENDVIKIYKNGMKKRMENIKILR